MQVTFSLVLGPASWQENSCRCQQRTSKAATATRLGWVAGQGQAKLFLKSCFLPRSVSDGHCAGDAGSEAARGTSQLSLQPWFCSPSRPGVALRMGAVAWHRQGGSGQDK